MAKRDEFDPNEILDDVTAVNEDDFDILVDLPDLTEPKKDTELDDLLSDDFLSMLGYEPREEETPAPRIEESEVEEDEAEEPIPFEDEDVKEYTVRPTPAFDVEMELDQDFMKSVEDIFPNHEEEDHQPIVPVVEGDSAEVPAAPVRRRKKLSKERLIKEVYLPPVILGLTLILLITFIGGAIGRAIKINNEEQAAIQESQQAASDALTREAEALIARADVLAAGYDYDSALAVLDTFSGDKTQYQNMLDAINNYTQAAAQLKPIDAPSSIPNLSFHCLIADPARAFSDKDWGQSYNQNYVTIDEFSKILEQLYAGGYVLVDFDSFIVETVGEDGKVTINQELCTGCGECRKRCKFDVLKIKQTMPMRADLQEYFLKDYNLDLKL